MRDIKFRALKDDMSNCNWIYGCLVYDAIGCPRITHKHKSGEGLLFNTCLKGTEGQFVGLMDMLTKDAYEGDIIERNASDGKGKVKGVIVFELGQFRVSWLDKNKGWNNSLYIHIEDSKIIGNIHENPELLTKQ